MISRPKVLLAAGLLSLLAWSLPGAAQQDASLEAARAALERGDGIAAEVEIEQALERGVPRPVLAARMGEAQLLQGNLAKAREWLAPAEFIESERVHGFRMLAQLEIREGRLEEAGFAYDAALAFAPEDPELWVDIARLRYAANNQLGALEASDYALQFESENAAALQLKAQLIRDAEGLEAALPWFERALEQAPDDLGLLGDYAATLSDAGRAGEMLTVVRRMIELDPRNPRAFYLQAVLAARTGRYRLARQLMYRTADAFAEMPAAMLLEVVLDLADGNAGLASETLFQLNDRLPNNRQIQELQATALTQDGATGEVIALFGELARAPGASSYLITTVARAHEAEGDREQAGELLDRAAQVRSLELVPLGVAADTDYLGRQAGENPGRIDYGIAAIRSLVAAGQAGEAVRAADNLAARFPGAFDVMTIRADAYLANGDPAAALGHYRRASSIRTTWSLTLRQVAAHRALGRNADARSVLADWVRQHPLDRRAGTMLAKLAIADRDWTLANRILDFARPDERRDPDGLARRAIARLRSSGTGAEADAAQAYAFNRSLGAASYAYALALGGDVGDGRARALLTKAERMNAAGGELQSF